jgi:hypothetical protein
MCLLALNSITQHSRGVKARDAGDAGGEDLAGQLLDAQLRGLAGVHVQFGYVLGWYFLELGIYTVRWEGENLVTQ